MAQGTLDVTTGLQKRTNPSKLDRLFMINPETAEPQYIEMDQVTGQVRGDMLPAFDLDNIRVMTSKAPDNKDIKSNVLDPLTGQIRTFKELPSAPEHLDGRLFFQHDGRFWGDADFLVNRIFNVSKMGGDPTAVNFSDAALNLIKLLMRDGDKIVFPHGTYRFQSNHTFDKDIEIDFGGSEIIFQSQNSLIFTGVEKSLHHVTTDYSTNNGQNFLILNNTSGIIKGDIINVISTELYDTSRTYNYKGGNFLVTSVAGNTVFFDGVFPFNMAGASIEVKIYKPSNVNLYNLKKLTNTRPVATTMYGIRLLYCAMSEITNVNTENSRYNIDLYRCVGVTLNNITTGHAKDFTDSQGGNYDAYGIAIESCTNVTCNNVRTNSGQHGITNGGREVCFNLTFNDCSFKSENSEGTGVGPSSGFGAHANLYNATFNSCVLHGILLSGNCTLNDCDLFTQQVSSVLGNLHVSDNPRYANFIFNDCRLSGILRLRDTAQVMTAERKYVGKIKFNNCRGIHLRTEVSLNTTIGKIADIDTIEINNCSDVRVYFNEKVRIIKFFDVEKNPTDRLITMENVSTRQCSADSVYIDDVAIVGPTYSVGFRVRNCNNLRINNLICPTGNSSTTYPGEIFNVKNLVVENTDTTNVPRPFSLSVIDRMRVVNSDINSTSNAMFNTFLSTPNYVMTDRLKKVLSSEIFNVRMGAAGKRYNQTINSSGAMVLTEILP